MLKHNIYKRVGRWSITRVTLQWSARLLRLRLRSGYVQISSALSIFCGPQFFAFRLADLADLGRLAARTGPGGKASWHTHGHTQRAVPNSVAFGSSFWVESSSRVRHSQTLSTFCTRGCIWSYDQSVLDTWRKFWWSLAGLVVLRFRHRDLGSQAATDPVTFSENGPCGSLGFWWLCPVASWWLWWC